MMEEQSKMMASHISFPESVPTITVSHIPFSFPGECEDPVGRGHVIAFEDRVAIAQVRT